MMLLELVVWPVVALAGLGLYMLAGAWIGLRYDPEGEKMRGDESLGTAWVLAWPVFAVPRLLWAHGALGALRRPAEAPRAPGLREG